MSCFRAIAAGSGGGTAHTIYQIESAVGAKTSAQGWYAQAQSGTLFDGSQFKWRKDQILSGGVFQPAVMPTGGWWGLTASDNRQVSCPARACSSAHLGSVGQLTRVPLPGRRHLQGHEGVHRRRTRGLAPLRARGQVRCRVTALATKLSVLTLVPLPTATTRKTVPTRAAFKTSRRAGTRSPRRAARSLPKSRCGTLRTSPRSRSVRPYLIFAQTLARKANFCDARRRRVLPRRPVDCRLDRCRLVPEAGEWLW